MALSLAEEGLNASQIARATKIPRSTIRDWLGRPPKAPRAPFDQALVPRREYAYVLGLYLGDGYICRIGRGMCMRIAMDSRYPAIIEEARVALSAVLAPRKASVYVCRHQNMVEVRGYSGQLPMLFPQHGPGPKHMRPIVLVDWQREIVDEWPEEFLRGLIHSDGCRCMNKVWSGKYAYPRYFFSQVSRDIMNLFCRTCEQLGIEYRWCSWKQVSIAKAASVARLDEFIGPKA